MTPSVSVLRASSVPTLAAAFVVASLGVLVRRPCTLEEAALDLVMYPTLAGCLVYALAAARTHRGRRAAGRIAVAVGIFIVCAHIGANATAWLCARRARTTRNAIARVVSAMEPLRASGRGSLPQSLDALEKQARVPIPRVDGWGNPISLVVQGTHYSVVSRGKCGEPDLIRARGDEGDLIATDGRLVRWPDNVVVCP